MNHEIELACVEGSWRINFAGQPIGPGMDKRTAQIVHDWLRKSQPMPFGMASADGFECEGMFVPYDPEELQAFKDNVVP